MRDLKAKQVFASQLTEIPTQISITKVWIFYNLKGILLQSL